MNDQDLTWRIRLDDPHAEPQFWSNADGWGDPTSATLFTDAERVVLRLPDQGKWEPVRKGEIVSDQDLIDAGILRAQATGVPIDDLTAKIIASQWHGGQFTALYALSSSGALDLYSDDREDNCPVEDEIEHELLLLATKLVQGIPDSGLNEARQFAIELQALMDYVKARRLAGNVEMQDGWSDLHW